jgi:hypothetical protein
MTGHSVSMIRRIGVGEDVVLIGEGAYHQGTVEMMSDEVFSTPGSHDGR